MWPGSVYTVADFALITQKKCSGTLRGCHPVFLLISLRFSQLFLLILFFCCNLNLTLGRGGVLQQSTKQRRCYYIGLILIQNTFQGSRLVSRIAQEGVVSPFWRSLLAWFSGSSLANWFLIRIDSTWEYKFSFCLFFQTVAVKPFFIIQIQPPICARVTQPLWPLNVTEQLRNCSLQRTLCRHSALSISFTCISID